jgi:hypothetical protein
VSEEFVHFDANSDYFFPGEFANRDDTDVDNQLSWPATKAVYGETSTHQTETKFSSQAVSSSSSSPSSSLSKSSSVRTKSSFAKSSRVRHYKRKLRNVANVVWTASQAIRSSGGRGGKDVGDEGDFRQTEFMSSPLKQSEFEEEITDEGYRQLDDNVRLGSEANDTAALESNNDDDEEEEDDEGYAGWDPLLEVNHVHRETDDSPDLPEDRNAGFVEDTWMQSPLEMLHQRAHYLFLSAIFCPAWLAMTLCYCRVYTVARRHARAIAAVHSSVQHNMRFMRFVMRDSKPYTRTLALVVGLFLLSWTPYLACLLLHVLSEGESRCGGSWTWPYLTLLAVLNSGFNPWVYAFKNHEFRTAFRKMLRAATPRCLKTIKRTLRHHHAPLSPQELKAEAARRHSSLTDSYTLGTGTTLFTAANFSLRRHSSRLSMSSLGSRLGSLTRLAGNATYIGVEDAASPYRSRSRSCSRGSLTPGSMTPLPCVPDFDSEEEQGSFEAEARLLTSEKKKEGGGGGGGKWFKRNPRNPPAASRPYTGLHTVVSALDLQRPTTTLSARPRRTLFYLGTSLDSHHHAAHSARVGALAKSASAILGSPSRQESVADYVNRYFAEKALHAYNSDEDEDEDDADDNDDDEEDKDDECEQEEEGGHKKLDISLDDHIERDHSEDEVDSKQKVTKGDSSDHSDYHSDPGDQLDTTGQLGHTDQSESLSHRAMDRAPSRQGSGSNVQAFRHSPSGRHNRPHTPQPSRLYSICSDVHTQRVYVGVARRVADSDSDSDSGYTTQLLQNEGSCTEGSPMLQRVSSSSSIRYSSSGISLRTNRASDHNTSDSLHGENRSSCKLCSPDCSECSHLPASRTSQLGASRSDHGSRLSLLKEAVLKPHDCRLHNADSFHSTHSCSCDRSASKQQKGSDNSKNLRRCDSACAASRVKKSDSTKSEVRKVVKDADAKKGKGPERAKNKRRATSVRKPRNPTVQTRVRLDLTHHNYSDPTYDSPSPNTPHPHHTDAVDDPGDARSNARIEPQLVGFAAFVEAMPFSSHPIHRTQSCHELRHTNYYTLSPQEFDDMPHAWYPINNVNFPPFHPTPVEQARFHLENDAIQARFCVETAESGGAHFRLRDGAHTHVSIETESGEPRFRLEDDGGETRFHIKEYGRHFSHSWRGGNGGGSRLLPDNDGDVPHFYLSNEDDEGGGDGEDTRL